MSDQDIEHADAWTNSTNYARAVLLRLANLPAELLALSWEQLDNFQKHEIREAAYKLVGLGCSVRGLL